MTEDNRTTYVTNHTKPMYSLLYLYLTVNEAVTIIQELGTPILWQYAFIRFSYRSTRKATAVLNQSKLSSTRPNLSNYPRFLQNHTDAATYDHVFGQAFPYKNHQNFWTRNCQGPEPCQLEPGFSTNTMGGKDITECSFVWDFLCPFYGSDLVYCLQIWGEASVYTQYTLIYDLQ